MSRSLQSRTRCSSRCRKGKVTWGSSLRGRRNPAPWSARCATRMGVCDSRSIASSPLFSLLRHVSGRQRRAFAEKEILHVLRDDLLRFFLPGHQAVLVEDHLHALFPELPRLRRDALVDALAKIARPWRRIEPGHLLLKLHALHRTAALVAGRSLIRRRSRGTFVHIAMVTRFVQLGVLLGVDSDSNLNCKVLLQCPRSTARRVAP